MTTPWWQVLRLRPEVGASAGNIDDVQMSLFRAVYADPPAPYGDPAYYGAITYPTTTLAGLIGRIAVRLGGGDRYTSVRALYHLDQGMGGGKSHGLIGLYHMAHSTDVFKSTDIGKMAWADAKARLGGVEPDLKNTHVAVLSADRMTPFAPDNRPEVDGPARTLWERFLWRLVDRDYKLFTRFQSRWDQEGITEALASLNRPVLILMDEIMDYVRQLDDARYENERNAELAFLKALFDAVNDVPHVAMVVVMISTERDRAVYGPLAQRLREELQANMVRNGASMAVTEASDFSQILRRRLFETSAPDNVTTAAASAFIGTSAPWKVVLQRVPGADAASFPAAVARAYPFHPDLLRLIETEWATLAGYQRVRSTVTLFAQTAYTWVERASQGEWVPFLIGPGDLPLENGGVREALLGSGIIESDTTVANYRQVIATDIVGEGGKGGVAAGMDQAYASTDPWHKLNPRAAQRMATALLLYSLAPRAGGKLGATEAEIKAASFVPDASYAATDAETVFNGLKDTDTGLGALDVMAGLGGQPARYQLTTRQTLQMLFRVQRAAVTERDRDVQIAAVAERSMSSGPGFSKARFIRDDRDAQGNARADREILADLDESNTTRLAVLDPSRWTLLNGRDDETRRVVVMAFGVGPGALAVTHAASLVIACVNTQRRNQARLRAADFLAWTRVGRVQVVADDAALLAQANTEINGAKAALERDVKRAFQHYAYLVRDADNKLEVRSAKFDEDSKTSLSGAQVWDQLVGSGRAVTPNGLMMGGLMLALRDELPLSLSEVTARFWTNPRMPMLSGVEELRHALFSALTAGRLELVNADAQVAPPPEQARDLPIGTATITVRLPAPKEKEEEGEIKPEQGGEPAGGSGGGLFGNAPPSSSGGPAGIGTSIARASLWTKIQADLSDEGRRENVVTLLRRLASIADDGDLETFAMTIEIIGDKERLNEAIGIAMRVEGTQRRLEDLPD